jgi:hypothetical protein
MVCIVIFIDDYLMPSVYKLQLRDLQTNDNSVWNARWQQHNNGNEMCLHYVF